MAKIDLTKLSIEELQTLAQDIEQEIVSRREQDRERVLAQMRDLAGSIGMSLEDLLKQERGRDRARVPAAAAARYRHPENAALTWAGRGKRPQWIVEWLASGRTLEELESGGE
jgi:DNA-binding protein H-NS